MAHHTNNHSKESRQNSLQCAKSYRSMGLLATLGKLFSALVAADLSYLMEKHNLLPPNQFRGRPSRHTTDTMHLLVQKIKDANALLIFLRKPLPTSLSMLWQESKLRTQCCWTQCWKSSPHYCHLGGIDKSVPSKNWMKIINPLSHNQASIIMQLHTGHIGLNKHLHHIKCSNTLYCPNCDENAIEDRHHFLFVCTGY